MYPRPAAPLNPKSLQHFADRIWPPAFATCTSARAVATETLRRQGRCVSHKSLLLRLAAFPAEAESISKHLSGRPQFEQQSCRRWGRPPSQALPCPCASPDAQLTAGALLPFALLPPLQSWTPASPSRCALQSFTRERYCMHENVPGACECLQRGVYCSASLHTDPPSDMPAACEVTTHCSLTEEHQHTGRD